MRYLPYLRSALALSTLAATMHANAASHYTAAVAPHWEKNWSSFNNFGDFAGGSSIYVKGTVYGNPSDQPTDSFAAYAINDSGVAVGALYSPTGSYGVIFKDGSFTSSNTLPDGINNAGMVVGSISGGVQVGGPPYEPIYNRHASRDVGVTTWDLGTLGGLYSNASAVNDKGQIVGYATVSDGPAHSFLYTDGKMIDLGKVAGYRQSQANDINNQGLIIGDATDTNWATIHAYVYDHGKISLIDAPADLQSKAAAVNNWGQVVGTVWGNAPGSAYYAYLYENGQTLNLNNLLDPAAGWNIKQALDVNDRGQILAYACKSDMSCGSVVLSPDVLSALPVPEPETYGMLLSGLAILGWAARRKRAPR